MKISTISVKNFKGFDVLSLNLDSNVNYLIGKNGSGKSGLGFDAIVACLQGVATKGIGGNKPLNTERFRVISPKARAADIVVTLVEENGNTIDVIRKITASSQTVEFRGTKPDIELNQDWLNRLFNEFLIAPKRFLELSSKEQAIKLGIDTATFDNDIKELKSEYTLINRDIKNFGVIEEVAKVEAVDISQLLAGKTSLLNERVEARKAIADKLNELYKDNVASNKKLRIDWEEEKRVVDVDTIEFNKSCDELVLKIDECAAAKNTLSRHGYNEDGLRYWVSTLEVGIKPKKVAHELYAAEPEYKTERPDDIELTDFDLETNSLIAEIDIQIQNANTTNQNALLYSQYVAASEKKAAKELELKANEEKQLDKLDLRLKYIKAFNLPFGNLSIDDDGNLLKEGRPIKEPHFSSGELLKMVPILISTVNPELKYVFLQDFNLMDEDKQAEIIDYLTGKGFQLVIELVGRKAISDKNCIILRQCKVVESYEDEVKENLAA